MPAVSQQAWLACLLWSCMVQAIPLSVCPRMVLLKKHRGHKLASGHAKCVNLHWFIKA